MFKKLIATAAIIGAFLFTPVGRETISFAQSQGWVIINGVMQFAGNVSIISPGVLKLPSGTAAAPSATFTSAPTKGWYLFDANTLGFSGHLFAGTDNTYDVGATAANRPRTGYFATSVVTPTVNATTAFQANGTPGVTGTCDTPTFSLGVATTCGGSGNSSDGTYFVTGNFTTANNANFQLITGLAWTFPANSAVNSPFHCSITYSQATAAVSDSLGIQDVTVAPTNGMFTGSAETALGTTAYGDLTGHNTTTATAVVTFTPSAITTILGPYIEGLVEQPSNGSSSAFQIQIKTTAGADAITVYRGSYCKVG